MADPVALNNVTARLHHFEPIKIAQGFARPRQGILNRFLNALGRGADELDDAINVIFHHSPFINYGRTSIFALALWRLQEWHALCWGVQCKSGARAPLDEREQSRPSLIELGLVHCRAPQIVKPRLFLARLAAQKLMARSGPCEVGR